jgi:membrane protein DedA with SNARE-associated domain
MLTATAVALPGILQSLAPVLNHYGYLAVAGLIFLEDFGVPVPGETVLIAAAIYAGAGRLNTVLVGVIALGAAIAGDNVGFAIGHFAGRTVVARYGRYVMLTEARLAKAEEFFEKRGGPIIVVARFIEGLRQANGIVAGLSEMPWRRCMMFNALGAGLRVGLWMTLGVAAGSHITAIYNGITRYSLYALGVAVLVVIALIVRHVRRHRDTHRPSPAP